MSDEKLYLLFWTSETHSDWNGESLFTSEQGRTIDEILVYVSQLKRFCLDGDYGPDYDWRLVEV